MINILKSELYKIKHTWLPWLYLFLPILFVIMIYAGFKFTSLSRYSIEDVTLNYLITLGALFPIIIGFITAKVIEMEAEAGCFQIMLTGSQSRTSMYIGKLLSLLLCASLSLVILQSSFLMFFNYQEFYDLILESVLMIIGVVPLYLIHLVISLRFGSGASIGLGFFETLIALLAVTSMGDKIWYYIPSSWSSRLCGLYFVDKISGENLFYYDFFKWSLVATPMIVVILFVSLIWFSKWNGRTNME
ncbi:lantibiotic immunity ABC transporter MutG family permease subunit [Streptococcus infantis]|uniref:lantibiotic immunity ABC transporter MutG family permease subunit n=1 Tax=Streptococcus infantis TaxID=68892 RepID=UPI0039C40EC5